MPSALSVRLMLRNKLRNNITLTILPVSLFFDSTFDTDPENLVFVPSASSRSGKSVYVISAVCVLTYAFLYSCALCNWHLDF
jgi:hypothetical protein